MRLFLTLMNYKMLISELWNGTWFKIKLGSIHDSCPFPIKSCDAYLRQFVPHVLSLHTPFMICMSSLCKITGWVKSAFLMPFSLIKILQTQVLI